MIIPPYYQITSEIFQLLSEIEALKIYFSSIEIPLNKKEWLRKAGLLKSSLFSAKIEGNSLTFEDVENSSKEQEKKEVFNILKAIEYIENIKTRKITKQEIIIIHQLVINGSFKKTGSFRQTPEAIFNQAGVAVEIFPSATKINDLMDELFKYLNSDKEKFPLIKAFIGHLIFEKIHPFIDGNGRVGRLLIGLILKLNNYSLGLIVPFEECIEENREKYYFYLESGIKNPQNYLVFMLTSFLEQAKKIKKQLEEKINENIPLPPRQEEIYQIVKDHGLVSFDFILRRFLAVPQRTLRYDLKKITEKGLVVKVGRTNKSLYRIKKSGE